MHDTTVWSFKTKRYTVTLQLTADYGHRYDGEDMDGETQMGLDEGTYVAFDSLITVSKDGYAIGRSSLGASIYDAANIQEFWTAHRDPNPVNRNSSIMRAAHGDNHSICHYFPELVREAITEARKTLAD